MREAKFQGTAGYVTRMSGGVGGRGREASSYPDLCPRIGMTSKEEKEKVKTSH